MRRVSFALAVLTILGLALGVVGCAPQAQAPQTIKVGVIAELTGDLAVIGQMSKNGVELAVNEINDAGGVEISMKKYKLEPIVEDCAGKEDLAIAAAQKLIAQDDVLAIIGPDISKAAIPASWVAENTKTVMIGTSVTNPDFTVDPQTKQPKKYVFSVTFNDDFQGAALAKFALTQLGATKAAVLYDSESAFNRGLAERFKESFTAGVGDEGAVFVGLDGVPIGPAQSFAGEVVAFESYKTGDTDFTAQLTRIKKAAPDVLFMPNYLNEVPLQAKQARALGIDVPLLGADTWAVADLLKACGSNCEGAYLTTDFRPEIPNEAAQKFIADYTAKYGSAPESPAALAYDAVQVLALALERAAKVDREAMRDGMTGVSRYEGVTGHIEFKAGSGVPIKSANIMQIKDGKFVWFANVQP